MENLSTSAECQKISDDEREMRKNIRNLSTYLNAGKTKVKVDELKNKGFNSNHFTNRVKSLQGEVIYAFEGYFLHRKNDNELVITKI